jgi:preprotein translocase subunit SecG
MMFGGVSEWHLAARGKEGRWQALAFYILSCVMFVAAWVPVIVSFFVTTKVGLAPGQTTPGFVYVIVFVLLGLQMPFVIVFTVKMWHMWTTTLSPAEFLEQHGYRYELWYIYMSFVAKTVLAWTVFGGAFQLGDVTNIPEPESLYSQWIIAAFLVGGLMWIISAITYRIDQDQSAVEATSTGHRFGGGNTQGTLLRLTAVLAAALEIITICLGIGYMNDVSNYGWIAGLALGVHIGCEALFIPAMDKVVHKSSSESDGPTPHERRTALMLRIASFIGYGAYVILCMIQISDSAIDIVVIVFGAIVMLRLLVIDTIVKMHLLFSGSLKAAFGEKN